MEIFDNVDELDLQVEATRGKLEALEEDISREQAMIRLRRAYPMHPVLLARQLFIVMTAVGAVSAAGVFVLPVLAPPDIARDLASFQAKIGIPLPIVLGMLAVCMGVAWMMSTQAAISIGRECPLAPWEKKERERLAAELSRLTRQRQMMERVKGTPMGARPRLLTPVPATRGRTPTPAGAGGSRTDGPGAASGPSYAAPTELVSSTPPPFGRSQPFSLPPRTPVGGASRDGGRATPLGAPPRSGTPVGARRLGMPATSLRPAGERVPEPLFEPLDTPTDHYADASGEPDSGSEFVIDESPPPTAPTLPPYAEATSQGGTLESFGRTTSTQIPRWGDLREEWLIDAVEKAQILAESFPIQARLEFNVTPGLPFTLVLERATPAMAVRAMMAFVEFLASIATPARARVELRSVAHLDRSFHRNIKAALDPYFPGSAEVVKQGDAVEVIFHAPDTRWNAYPHIPTVE